MSTMHTAEIASHKPPQKDKPERRYFKSFLIALDKLFVFDIYDTNGNVASFIIHIITRKPE